MSSARRRDGDYGTGPGHPQRGVGGGREQPWKEPQEEEPQEEEPGALSVVAQKPGEGSHRRAALVILLRAGVTQAYGVS